MEKIQVLIVDDHPMVIAGMRSLLSNLDFIGIAGVAANAFEAVALLKTSPVDVAIVDINLPDVNGIELTATTYRAQITPAAPAASPLDDA